MLATATSPNLRAYETRTRAYYVAEAEARVIWRCGIRPRRWFDYIFEQINYVKYQGMDRLSAAEIKQLEAWSEQIDRDVEMDLIGARVANCASLSQSTTVKKLDYYSRAYRPPAR